jgi:hypothetical protein
LAKPAAERVLFAAIADGAINRIVEIGVGDCSRGRRLIDLSAKYGGETVSYCGLDLFESAPHGRATMRLKDAFRKLQMSGAKIKLVPGEPQLTMATCANGLTNTDLIVFGSQFDWESLGPVWMYVPRMLGKRSQVWRQLDDGCFERISFAEVERLAERAIEQRRKSA